MPIKKIELDEKIRRGVTLGFVVFLLILSIGAIKAYKQPLMMTDTMEICNYDQSSIIDYKVHLKNNTLFAKKVLGPDLTYFSKITKSIEVQPEYRFSTSCSRNVEGYYDIIAVLRDPGVWEKRYPVERTVRFNEQNGGVEITKGFTIYLDDYKEKIDAIEKQIEYKSSKPELLIEFNTYTKAVNGTDFENNVVSTLSIPFTSVYSIESKAISTTSMPITLTRKVANKNIEKKRIQYVISIIISMLFLLTARIITIPKVDARDDRQRILDDFFSKHKDYIIKVSSVFPPKDEGAVVFMRSLEEMAKISEEIAKPMIHQIGNNDGKDVFFLFDDTTTYICEVE